VLANKLMIIAALLMKERSRRRKATRNPAAVVARAINSVWRMPVRPKMARKRSQIQPRPSRTARRGDSSINDKYAFHDRDKNFCSRCIRFNFDHALLALSFYRDGCDWTSGKIAMRSPRTEPSQSSLAT
jgi:hypothetical protein